MSSDDRYGGDVLAGDWRARGRRVVPAVVAARGEVVEHAGSGFTGAVLDVGKGLVRLEDRRGAVRTFPLTDGWLVDGAPVRLEPPRAAAVRAPERTASGSRAAPAARARIARGSRILVEGRHDAELIERVWGDDLRDAGVVVELLDGIDRLGERIADLEPAADRRLGILVDHLVAGSKESRIAAAVERGPHAAWVRIVGHPYVDVWAAVKPARLGLERWPDVPRDVEWKAGIAAALGWPHAGAGDLAAAWQRILGRVRDWNDLEPALLGRVEELIDFVTVD